MNKGNRIEGEYHISKRYPLYLVGARYSPWLVMSEDQGFHVSGQLYSVGEEAMKWMDKLERVSESDGYHKVTIDIVHNLTEKERRAYVYIKRPEQLTNADIQLGPLRRYELEHSALYQPRNVKQPRKANQPHKAKPAGRE